MQLHRRFQEHDRLYGVKCTGPGTFKEPIPLLSANFGLIT